MTNQEIEKHFEQMVKEERRITKEVIELIGLIEERKIFAERGYSSLFDWLTGKYGYSEPAAYRRINAARLLRAVPDATAKLERGELNLTTLAKAQSIIRAEERASKQAIAPDVKAKALAQIENQSLAKSEQTLLALFPQAASKVKQERITALTENASRLNSNIPNDVLARFERVRDLLAHKIPNASFVEAADYFFKKNF